jgi:hypothetical protein
MRKQAGGKKNEKLLFCKDIAGVIYFYVEH